MTEINTPPPADTPAESQEGDDSEQKSMDFDQLKKKIFGFLKDHPMMSAFLGGTMALDAILTALSDKMNDHRFNVPASQIWDFLRENITGEDYYKAIWRKWASGRSSRSIGVARPNLPAIVITDALREPSRMKGILKEFIGKMKTAAIQPESAGVPFLDFLGDAYWKTQFGFVLPEGELSAKIIHARPISRDETELEEIYSRTSGVYGDKCPHYSETFQIKQGIDASKSVRIIFEECPLEDQTVGQVYRSIIRPRGVRIGDSLKILVISLPNNIRDEFHLSDRDIRHLLTLYGHGGLYFSKFPNCPAEEFSGAVEKCISSYEQYLKAAPPDATLKTFFDQPQIRALFHLTSDADFNIDIYDRISRRLYGRLVASEIPLREFDAFYGTQEYVFHIYDPPIRAPITLSMEIRSQTFKVGNLFKMMEADPVLYKDETDYIREIQSVHAIADQNEPQRDDIDNLIKNLRTHAEASLGSKYPRPPIAPLLSKLVAAAINSQIRRFSNNLIGLIVPPSSSVAPTQPYGDLTDQTVIIQLIKDWASHLTAYMEKIAKFIYGLPIYSTIATFNDIKQNPDKNNYAPRTLLAKEIEFKATIFASVYRAAKKELSSSPFSHILREVKSPKPILFLSLDSSRSLTLKPKTALGEGTLSKIRDILDAIIIPLTHSPIDHEVKILRRIQDHKINPITKIVSHNYIPISNTSDLYFTENIVANRTLPQLSGKILLNSLEFKEWIEDCNSLWDEDLTVGEMWNAVSGKKIKKTKSDDGVASGSITFSTNESQIAQVNTSSDEQRNFKAMDSNEEDWNIGIDENGAPTKVLVDLQFTGGTKQPLILRSFAQQIISMASSSISRVSKIHFTAAAIAPLIVDYTHLNHHNNYFTYSEVSDCISVHKAFSQLITYFEQPSPTSPAAASIDKTQYKTIDFNITPQSTALTKRFHPGSDSFFRGIFFTKMVGLLQTLGKKINSVDFKTFREEFFRKRSRLATLRFRKGIAGKFTALAPAGAELLSQLENSKANAAQPIQAISPFSLDTSKVFGNNEDDMTDFFKAQMAALEPNVIFYSFPLHLQTEQVDPATYTAEYNTINAIVSPIESFITAMKDTASAIKTLRSRPIYSPEEKISGFAAFGLDQPATIEVIKKIQDILTQHQSSIPSFNSSIASDTHKSTLQAALSVAIRNCKKAIKLFKTPTTPPKNKPLNGAIGAEKTLHKLANSKNRILTHTHISRLKRALYKKNGVKIAAKQAQLLPSVQAKQILKQERRKANKTIKLSKFKKVQDVINSPAALEYLCTHIAAEEGNQRDFASGVVRDIVGDVVGDIVRDIDKDVIISPAALKYLSTHIAAEDGNQRNIVNKNIIFSDSKAIAQDFYQYIQDYGSAPEVINSNWKSHADIFELVQQFLTEYFPTWHPESTEEIIATETELKARLKELAGDEDEEEEVEDEEREKDNSSEKGVLKIILARMTADQPATFFRHFTKLILLENQTSLPAYQSGAKQLLVQTRGNHEWSWYIIGFSKKPATISTPQSPSDISFSHIYILNRFLLYNFEKPDKNPPKQAKTYKIFFSASRIYTEDSDRSNNALPPWIQAIYEALQYQGFDKYIQSNPKKIPENIYIFRDSRAQTTPLAYKLKRIHTYWEQLTSTFQSFSPTQPVLGSLLDHITNTIINQTTLDTSKVKTPLQDAEKLIEISSKKGTLSTEDKKSIETLQNLTIELLKYGPDINQGIINLKSVMAYIKSTLDSYLTTSPPVAFNQLLENTMPSTFDQTIKKEILDGAWNWAGKISSFLIATHSDLANLSYGEIMTTVLGGSAHIKLDLNGTLRIIYPISDIAPSPQQGYPFAKKDKASIDIGQRSLVETDSEKTSDPIHTAAKQINSFSDQRIAKIKKSLKTQSYLDSMAANPSSALRSQAIATTTQRKHTRLTRAIMHDASAKIIRSLVPAPSNKYIDQRQSISNTAQPPQLVMENLKVMPSKRASPEMSVISSRFAHGLLQDYLSQKAAMNYASIRLIPPAYTSKICSKCHREGWKGYLVKISSIGQKITNYVLIDLTALFDKTSFPKSMASIVKEIVNQIDESQYEMKKGNLGKYGLKKLETLRDKWGSSTPPPSIGIYNPAYNFAKITTPSPFQIYFIQMDSGNTFYCPHCAANGKAYYHDRDINATANIRNYNKFDFKYYILRLHSDRYKDKRIGKGQARNKISGIIKSLTENFIEPATKNIETKYDDNKLFPRLAGHINVKEAENSIILKNISQFDIIKDLSTSKLYDPKANKGVNEKFKTNVENFKTNVENFAKNKLPASSPQSSKSTGSLSTLAAKLLPKIPIPPKSGSSTKKSTKKKSAGG